MVIDTYDPKNTEEAKFKEKKTINDREGISKLDNKKNECNKKNGKN
ncbi:hypothetical protein [Sphingobacterium kyonggiense]